jgi:hypothetical protein
VTYARAVIDQRGQAFLVSSYSRTSDGFSIMNGFVRRMPLRSTDAELGEAIFEALAHSQIDIPTPPREAPVPWHAIRNGLGIGSEKEYMKGTISVSVDRSERKFVLTPTRNGGTSEGFVPIVEAARSFESPSTDELGGAARAALAVSS